MPQLHGEDRLERADAPAPQEPADGDDSSPLPPRRRCSVSARVWGCRTARSLCCSAEAGLQWHAHEGGPRHCSENDRGRAARSAVSGAPSSSPRRRKSDRFFVLVSFTPLVAHTAHDSLEQERRQRVYALAAERGAQRWTLKQSLIPLRSPCTDEMLNLASTAARRSDGTSDAPAR